jgi:FAD-linked oxidoreductase
MSPWHKPANGSDTTSADRMSATHDRRWRRLQHQGRRRWTTWGGTFQARPASVVTPRSTDEVAELVATAARNGMTVKAVGTGHSFTDIAITDGLLIRPGGMTALRSVDTGSGLVTVEGGLLLCHLNAMLAAHGLAMTNLGDIDKQTVAGAMATGTHGTGRDSGALASMVRGLELVLADGQVVRCGLTREPELFAAARVGLGAFGVITAVTLQTEPAFLLQAKEAPGRLDEILESFDDLVAANDHFEFHWFPHTDRVLLKRNNRVEPPARPLRRLRAFVDDELLANVAFSAVCRFGRAAPGFVPLVNQVSSRALTAREYVDASHRVFTSSRRVHFVESEYAVPRAAAVSVLRELRACIDRSPWRITIPVEVRVAPADDLWLSTAHSRDTAYIAVHVFRRTPHEDYFQALEEIAVGVGGRPHWGKLHTRDSSHLALAYPRFADTVRVRDRVDPDRVFANAYLDRVLGP